MIVKTDAVVLRARKFSETSLIVPLYTEAYGKMTVMAKGARSSRSRLASVLQPMNYVHAVFYRKESRDLQLLSQCDLLESFSALSDDLERMAPAMMAVELVDLVTHPEEQSRPLFGLLVEALRSINNATKNPIMVLYYFEVHLLDLLGFRPDLGRCSECGTALTEAVVGSGKRVLHLSSGGLVCPDCSSRGLGLVPISAPAVRVLQRLQELRECEAATRISLPAAVRKEISVAVRTYLQIHVDGLDRLRADAVFASIL
jgi:DNA repair protein RecO (recombination protein O)